MAMIPIELRCWICGRDDGDIRIIFDRGGEDARPHHDDCVRLLRMHERKQLEDQREADYFQHRFNVDRQTAERWARESETLRRTGHLIDLAGRDADAANDATRHSAPPPPG